VNQEQIINVARELKGSPLILSDSGRKIGQVSDAIVHPTEGSLLGLVATNLGVERLLLAEDFHLFSATGAVIMPEDTHLNLDKINGALRDGVCVCRDLIGAEAITNSGKLLGRVIEVYVMKEELRTIYRVASSRLQRMFGGGFFVAGNLPHAWSKIGARLIFNAEVNRPGPFASLDEAAYFVQRGKRRLAFAGDKR